MLDDQPAAVPACQWEGQGAEELARRWGVPRVHLFERVGSTNDVAQELATRGAPAGTVVLAEEQTAGRGRGGREWQSPPGLGVWLSLVVRGWPPEAIGLMPLLVGLAAAQALDPFARPASVQVKWPNDLLVGGRKLAGVLCEAVWEAGAPRFVVAGIGINTLQRPEDFPAGIGTDATSLLQVSARPPERAEVAGAVVAGTMAALAEPVRTLTPARLGELAARDILRGREVVVTATTGTETGTALGIAPDGALLLRSGAGVLRSIRSGSVRPLSGEYG